MKIGLGVAITVHAVFLFLGLLQGSALYSAESPLTYVFWLSVLPAVTLGLFAALRDPGFCATTESAPCSSTHLRNVVSSNSTQGFAPTPTVEKTQNEPGPSCVSDPQELKVSPVRRDNQLEITSHLDVSLDVSSSCKESEFRELSDAEVERPDVHTPEGEPASVSGDSAHSRQPFAVQVQSRSDEIDILIPEASLQSPSPAPLAVVEPKELQQRFCTVCNIDQPLRAKHCSVCERCVLRYDHHCPWLSTCIGEKNHAIFLGYLYSQCTELALGIAAVSYELSSSEDELKNALRAVLIAVSAVLLALLVTLTMCQSVLVSVNLTTWEYRSWHKITYLSAQPKALLASPFSLSLRGNLCLFLQAPWSRIPIDWKKTAMLLSLHPLVN